jgi:Lon protease-like protein
MFDELPEPLPIFPLPNLVLFPHAVVPLHVFELRYRTMVRDALSGRREIVMTVLKPGWDRDYQGSPEFHALGCLGRIEEVEWLPNDCYNLKLAGVMRVRLGRIVREFPYRAARATKLEQHPYPEDDPIVAVERRALRDAHIRFARSRGVAEGVPETALANMSLEGLTNLLCMLADADATTKLRWLEMDSVLERAHSVREWIDRRVRERPRPGASGGEHN